MQGKKRCRARNGAGNGARSAPAGLSRPRRGVGSTRATVYKKPPLVPPSSSLWTYPSQHYGDTIQGRRGFEGATPSWVIWHLLERYTRSGDVILDPFCGGGTTLDVARDLDRRGIGFDLAPARADVQPADARALPLEDQSVDFVFMDPPYSTHLVYSEDPRCIGKLDAGTPQYFQALERVFKEVERVLRDRRFLALYVSDSSSKRDGFVPIGARLVTLLERRFRLIDHVAVVRGNKKLGKHRYHRAAAEAHALVRGFNHLLIAKLEREPPPAKRR